MTVGLLVVGEITQHMRDRLDPVFNLHFATEIDDMTGFLHEEGGTIAYALTDGHYGVPRDWMDALPALKLISNYGVGYDAIDVGLSRDRGVLVTHTPGVLSDEVATTALMLMLASYQDLLASDAYVRAGRWARDGHMPLSRSADNRRVGILGLGRIGLALAKKLEAFPPTSPITTAIRAMFPTAIAPTWCRWRRNPTCCSSSPRAGRIRAASSHAR